MKQQTSAPCEIEAKFQVESRHIFSDLLALRQLGSFMFAPTPQPEQQRNTYYDTATGDLDRAMHAFRIREVAGTAKATLKGPGNVTGATHSRTEWELALPSPDPNSLPASELRNQLYALTKGATLLPILTIRTLRHVISVSQHGQMVLELALDDVAFEIGGRSHTSLELEIELIHNGTITELEELVPLLSSRYQLLPEPRSKLARGLELLRQ